jgi:homoserine kinase
MSVIPREAKLSGSGPTLYLLNSDQGEISKWQRSYQALGLQTLLTSFGAEGAGLI